MPHTTPGLPAPQYDTEEVAAWLTDQQRQANERGDTQRAATLALLIAQWRQDQAAELVAATCPPHLQRPTWLRYALLVLLWASMLWLADLAIRHGIDQHAVAAGLVLGAMASHALAAVTGIVAVVPIIGPLLIKILSIPVIWLLNSIGYLVSMMAIKRGYSKDVLTYRGLTIALITGIVLGYIIGKLV